MFPPELQRILLLIGMAATAYLLVLAWHEDYGQPELPPETQTAPLVTPLAGDVPTYLPSEVPADAPAGSGLTDVPDASLLLDEAAPPPTHTQPEPVAAERLVQVRTNNLILWIDRLGGDLVRLDLLAFPVSQSRPDIAYQLLDNTPGQIYVAQSGLVIPDASNEARPLFSLHSATTDFRQAPGELVLRHVQADGVVIDKVYHLDPDDYAIGLSYRIHNQSAAPFRAALFGQIKRGDHKAPAAGTPIGMQPFVGPATTTDDDRYNKLKFKDLRERAYQRHVDGGWIAMLQHYFLSAWVPDQQQRNRFFGNHRPDGTYVVGFISPLQEVAPGAQAEMQATFYAGPKDQDRLRALAPNLNLTVDYGFLWWLALPLFKLLQWLHGLVGNWGLSIILLTLIIKIALYPLSAASFKSMANMRRVAPQMKRLQERYADDRQKLSQEMMALYKKEKANPLGGCLPMLLQMPVFIALYWVLFESVELRHAPFALWIKDLSAMDPYFVLPILMGVTMYVQQLLNPPVPDPVQAKIMKMMPIFFTVLFLFFPAGLVLYWFVNNVLSIAQQYVVNKQVEGAHAAANK